MKNKITFVYFTLSLLFVTVVIKAFYVQVLNREKLIAYSNSQVVRQAKSYPRRGHILDRNGSPLAINITKYNIFTFPKNNKGVLKKIGKISKIVDNISFKKIKKKSLNRKGKFTWLARKIELTKNQLTKLKKIKDIIIEKQPSRMYPNNELAAQTIGFVGIDNDGLAGLEYEFNDQLKGEAQIEKYIKDAKGRPIKFKSSFIDTKVQDLTLSIDKDIQATLEKYLKEGVEKHKALRGGAAVVDAQTGEIWAIANYPTFDPNNVRNPPVSDRKLAFVTDPFEPGSIFKTLTIASALENKIIKPDTNYFCERGKFKVGNHYINESDNNHVYEWLSVEDILKFSSNIGTTKIAFDLTFPLLKKTLHKFHIGKKTGIELPGESRGIFDKKVNVTPLRLSNISFGQGVATTGIHMLSAYAAIANGGYYVKPTLLKIKNKNEIRSKRILSKKITSQLEKMLIMAVEDGTGGNARVPHFTIAGKTSTAQRADGSGRYSGYISGFVGFPVNVNKKFVVYVYIDNPTKGYYGNAVAAPIFQKIVRKILYKKKEYSQFAKYDTSKNKNIDYVKTKQSATRKVKKGIMPNLLGLDKVSAFKILDKAKIKYDYKGFGVVRSQYPKSGVGISNNTIIKIKFKAPVYE